MNIEPIHNCLNTHPLRYPDWRFPLSHPCSLLSLVRCRQTCVVATHDRQQPAPAKRRPQTPASKLPALTPSHPTGITAPLCRPLTRGDVCDQAVVRTHVPRVRQALKPDMISTATSGCVESPTILDPSWPLPQLPVIKITTHQRLVKVASSQWKMSTNY